MEPIELTSGETFAICALILFAAVGAGNLMASMVFAVQDWWNRDQPDFSVEKIAQLNERDQQAGVEK